MWSFSWGYPFGHGGWFMGHGLFGMAFGVVLLIIILSLIITVVRALVCKAGENMDTKDSLKILKEKFARGEISEEEYNRMRDTLIG